MKASNVKHRIHVQRLLLAALISCLSLTANAATKGNWGTSSASVNGKAATINAPGLASNPGGSNIPMSPNIGGWTAAGNYGVPTGSAGTTMNMTANGNVFLSGTKYPFQAGYSVPWGQVAIAGASVLAAAGTGGPLGAAIAAMPYLIDWLTKSGGRLNPTTGALERNAAEQPSSDGFEYQVNYSAIDVPQWKNSPSAACMYAAERLNAILWSGLNWSYNRVEPNERFGPQCFLDRKNPDGTEYGSGPAQLGEDKRSVGNSPTPGQNWLPSSMDDIAPYMSARNPSDPRVVGEILERGGNITLPNPTVTGPSVIQGPEKNTTNSDGTRTVERTTYNYSTAGNVITNTTNNTTTTTYNADNSVRNTTTTTTTPAEADAPKDPEDPCKANPDRIGCMEADTPELEIPRENKTITWAPEDPFGSGACPVDQTVTLGTIGKSVKVTNWVQMCEWSLPLRAIVLALATFAAFLIVMPGETRV